MRMILQIIISNENLDLVTGIWAKFWLGTGIWYPPSRPSLLIGGIKADCVVVLALLKVTFLGKGDDKRLRGPFYGPLSCLPNLNADFMQGTYHGISSCL